MNTSDLLSVSFLFLLKKHFILKIHAVEDSSMSTIYSDMIGTYTCSATYTLDKKLF